VRIYRSLYWKKNPGTEVPEIKIIYLDEVAPKFNFLFLATQKKWIYAGSPTIEGATLKY